MMNNRATFKYGKFQVLSMRKLAILLAVLLLMPVIAVDTVVLINTTNGFTDDTFVDSANPTTNYGSNVNVRIQSQNTPSISMMREYFKINISLIPTSVAINSAILYVRMDSGIDGFNVSAHHINNDSWAEADLTWNNQICGSIAGNLSAVCNSVPSGYAVVNGGLIPYVMAFDVKSIIQSDISGNKLSSILLKSVNSNLTASYAYGVSTEGGTASQRPYLVVNYTTIHLTTINFTAPTNITLNRDYVWYNFTPTNNNLTSIPCYIEETKVGSSETETSVGSVTNNTLSSTLKTSYAYGQYSSYIKCQNSDSSYSNSSVVWFKINSQPIVSIMDIQTIVMNTTGTIDVTYVPVDYDSTGKIACIFTIDNTSYPVINATLGVQNDDLFSGITLGNHNLTITCTDALGGVGSITQSFVVTTADFRVCFYTYDDYRDWISNSSVSISNKPNAVRKTVLFNDTMAKVWLVHKVGISDYYHCTALRNGCAEFNVSVTATYDAYLADNTNFDNNCHPYTINPRYNEYVGKFYLATGDTVIENRFVSFEDTATNSQAQSTSLLDTVRQQIFFLLFIVVIVAGAYLGMMSGGSGLAVLTFVGLGIAMLMFFRDYILSGGLI